MNPTKAQLRSKALRDMKAMPGWEDLKVNCLDEISDGGWRKFIKLPVDQKTSKKAYEQQARYSVIQEILEWIETGIAEGMEE
jgi:hypothetical protein